MHMQKLTPPQERLLRELAVGSRFAYEGFQPREKLISLGFATSDEWDELTITPAGREWLKENDGK